VKYQILGNTGVKVSSVALGTANFGMRWGHGASLDESRAILDAFEADGGNFIDTADVYQFGESEEFLGTLLHGRRDDFFLATKYSSGASKTAGGLVTGNSRRAMVSSVESSLKRLRTDRIDLYWVHHPDDITPSEELVRGLEDLSRAGKILYAGLSNFSAWRLARAATLAELSHAVPIVASQFQYSLVSRQPERDMLKACQALQITPITWSPLGGGMLTGKYRAGEKGRAEGMGGKVFQAENNEQRSAILDEVLAIAAETGASPDQVAIAWVAAQECIPIIGPRTQAQYVSNAGFSGLSLTEAQIGRLNSVSQFDNDIKTAPVQALPDHVIPGKPVA